MATAKPVLTISSKNYGAWALRGWLMCKLAGLDFVEKVIPPDDPAMKAEMLLLSSSMRVPSLQHGNVKVWDTLAIGEYLNEIKPKAGLLPADIEARAHCRAICGEMHSGFGSMRGALPMNIKARFPGFKIWSRAQTDIDRVVEIWRECLKGYDGPFLFGAAALHGRCDVCAGGHPLHELRRGARQGLRRLLQAHHRAARDAGVDCRGEAGARGDRRARCRVLRSVCIAPCWAARSCGLAWMRTAVVELESRCADQ